MYKAVIRGAILTYSLLGIGYSQEPEFVLRDGEALNELGQRIIPKGMKLAHSVVKGDFGPTKGNIVVLFHKNDADFCTGWALIPEGNKYKKFILPTPDFQIVQTILSIFFANADTNADRELLILAEYYSGAGGRGPWYNVYVYHWTGEKLVHLDDISEELSDQVKYRTAQAVRNRLKQLGY